MLFLSVPFVTTSDVSNCRELFRRARQILLYNCIGPDLRETGAAMELVLKPLRPLWSISDLTVPAGMGGVRDLLPKSLSAW